eukprot:TRINITY_DN1163_c0_g1_i1.p1 TRINITY_DN1163_c0_g1~~TRINITY_DN1163_c0_g1_i1.p1  ORF type:complete len:152 (-),score=70.86 TRINITY_DN1163_c0_g1_i1:117-572(-)
MTQFTAEQIKEHNKHGDTWVSIHQKVYNLSEFMSEHPGGEEVLRDLAGTDATSDYVNVGHSKDADKLMEKYFVGELLGGKKAEAQVNQSAAAAAAEKKAEVKTPVVSTKATPAKVATTQKREQGSDFKVMAVPALFLILAVLAYLFFGNKA